MAEVGGIIIPDKRNKKVDERPVEFDIIQVGPLVTECEAGQRVLAGTYASTKQKFEGQEYHFICEDALFAILGDTKDFNQSE